MVGSPFWMPPEMIKRQVYGPAVDIWSFAICLLELANGEPPNRRSALKAMFVAGTEGYPQPFRNPNAWSEDFKDFISRCLEIEPSRRATADELLAVRIII
jgi:serine/threonine protein kinase